MNTMLFALLLLLGLGTVHAEASDYERINQESVAKAEELYGHVFQNEKHPLTQAIRSEIQMMTVMQQEEESGNRERFDNKMLAAIYFEYEKPDYPLRMANRLAKQLDVQPRLASEVAQPEWKAWDFIKPFIFRGRDFNQGKWFLWVIGIGLVCAVGIYLGEKIISRAFKIVVIGMALHGITMAEEPLNRHEFIQVAVTKAVNDLSKTEQVKKLRAKMFLANQGGDTATAEQASRELTAMKQTAEAKATLAAAEDWDKIIQAQQVQKGLGAPIVSTEDTAGIQRERLKHQQREREWADNEERYRTWLMEQAVLIEAEKLRRQIQR